MRTIIVSTAAAVVISTQGTSLARAQTTPFPPLQAAICSSGASPIVDKTKLAREVLRKYPLSVAALGNGTLPRDADLDVYRAVLVRSAVICEKNDFCTKADKDNMRDARGFLGQLLAGNITGYSPSGSVGPETYFRGPNGDFAIACQKDAAGKPIEAPGSVLVPPPKSDSPIRLRGKATDLFIDRSQKDFQNASQATVNFQNDDVALKRTSTIQGVVGYAFQQEFAEGFVRRLEVIPYVQANRSLSRTGTGKSLKRVATETMSFGSTNAFFAITPSELGSIGHVINLRPDYLTDLEDDSQILSVNLQYVPIINGGILNTYTPLIPEVVAGKPLFEVRWNNGWYLDKGLPTVAFRNDTFSRFGVYAGYALVSENPNVPLTFTTSYTALHGFAGGVDIGYVSNSLTLSLDPQKYFGITATYAKGIREDTAKHDDLWTIGLTGRF